MCGRLSASCPLRFHGRHSIHQFSSPAVIRINRQVSTHNNGHTFDVPGEKLHGNLSHYFLLIGPYRLSNILNRIMPAIPVPLFQVALGALFAAFPTGIYLDLEPELFFILFIAPLLYNDGMRTPREELWKLRGSILALAVGLVFATVLLGGYGIHAMAPAIPLSAAFAWQRFSRLPMQ